MQDIVQKYASRKPFLLYLSGDDSVSKEFESRILVKEEIIFLMVSLIE